MKNTFTLTVEYDDGMHGSDYNEMIDMLIIGVADIERRAREQIDDEIRMRVSG